MKYVKSVHVREGDKYGLKKKMASLDHAKFLVRDLAILKKEKPDELASRLTAVQLLYKNFSLWVKDLPEDAEEQEGLKDGDHPKKMVITGMKKCPFACNARYHADLMKALANVKSFTYTKSNRSWTPDLGKQTGHADGKGWKAYVDAADGKGTEWRMGFTMDYDEDLTVNINYCEVGH